MGLKRGRRLSASILSLESVSPTPADVNDEEELREEEERFRQQLAEISADSIGWIDERPRESGGRHDPDPRVHIRRAIEAAYGEGVGLDAVRRQRFYEDLTAPASHKDRTACVPHIDGDPAGQWLRENDPARTPAGAEHQLRAALEAGGMSLDEAGAAFARKAGRPTRRRVDLRGRVAALVLPLWEADEVRHDHLAAALGVPPQTLSDLMIPVERCQLEANPERLPSLEEPLLTPQLARLLSEVSSPVEAASFHRSV